MTLLGGVIGIVLVAVILSMRPIGVIGGTYPSFEPYLPGAASQSPGVPPLDAEGLFDSYQRLGRVRVGGVPATLSVSRTDDLVLPTGRVIATDPFFLDSPPFLIRLTPGSHPVMLLEVATSGSSRRVAAAMVRDGTADPVTWKPGRITDAGEPATAFAYATDGGTGSFSSPEAIERFQRLSELQIDDLFKRLADGFEATELTSTVVLDPTTGANVVAFSSGFGDGSYASWFGFDAAGDPVALLTSFDLIDSDQQPTGTSTP